MSTWPPKPPGSEEFFPLDMIRQLAPKDKIVSCDCKIAMLHGDDPSVGGMLIGPVEINGKTVAQKVAGGILGCRYELTFTAHTLFGETLVIAGDFHVGPTGAGSRDLAALDNVKSWLGKKLDDGADDALLQRLITSESRAIEKYLQRPVLAETRTDFVQGSGSPAIMPPATPIIAIEKILIDGAEAKVRHDGLTIWREDGGPWPRKSRIQVTYTAGYIAVPPDIEQACIELVALRFRERDRIGHQSKSVGGETISYITAAMPPSTKGALAAYRKVAPC